MMHGHEKSDLAIVAVKPANKAEPPAAEQSAAELTAAEPVEPRAGTKGNAGQQTMPWAQSQTSMSHALERIRQTFAVTHPRWEPYAGKPLVRFCAGGAMKIASLPLRAPAASWCDPAGESPAQVKGSVLLGSECCVATGDSGCEAYTAIAWGVGLSHAVCGTSRHR